MLMDEWNSEDYRCRGGYRTDEIYVLDLNGSKLSPSETRYRL